MNIDAAVLYRGLQYGSDTAGLPDTGASGAGTPGARLFQKFLRGKTSGDINNSPFLAPLLKYIEGERKKFLQTDIPALPWSLFKLYDSCGDRGKYQEPYFERRKRLTILGLSCFLWERAEDTAALEDCIWAVCDEYSWCLPAHMDGTTLLSGEKDSGEDNSIRLDLFACETGFALAECCAMLEDRLAPAVLGRARAEVRRRVISSYLKHGALWNWELMDNNWCAVCAGSIAAAALYLETGGSATGTGPSVRASPQDNLLLAGLLQRLMPVLERYIRSFYTDGVSPEGLSYWTYGMSFYVSAGDLLLLRTGGKINIFDDPQFKKIAAFQQHCYFPCGAAINFSDASDGDRFRLGLSCYLAEHSEGVTVPARPYRAIVSGSGQTLLDPCGRFAPALRDLVWAEEPAHVSGDEPRCAVFPEAQWLLCSGAGETGFAAKGGHNGESHNHNDVGSFIFYKNGLMVFCDLGAGEYTKDYFSDKRYTIFCNRSESHSVPVIGGQGQGAGEEYRALACCISSEGGAGKVGGDNNVGEMSLDIAGAYKVPGLLRLERRFRFDIDTGSLTLNDTFSFAENPLPVTERFVSLFEPALVKGTVRIDTGRGVCSLVKAALPENHSNENSDPVTGKIEHRDHYGKAVTVYTIDFPIHPGEKTFSTEFRIE